MTLRQEFSVANVTGVVHDLSGKVPARFSGAVDADNH
jgi:hypothetical protein